MTSKALAIQKRMFKRLATRAMVIVPALLKLKVAFRQHLPHPGPHWGSKGQPLLLETLLQQLLYPRIHNVDSL